MTAYLPRESCRPLPTFNHTITVLNKLKSTNSPTKLDEWRKTVLHGDAYSLQAVRTVTGTMVSVGNVVTVRIPKSEQYKPYSEWITDIETGFTLSVGDIVIKGEIEETEINPNTVNTILQKYQPDAFVIKTVKNNTGIVGLCEHYRIEGV